MSISGAALDIFCGIAIVIGILGTILPHVPGLLLSWAGVLLWAIFTDAGPGKWWAVGVATVLALVSTVLKYLLPGRRMAKHGVPGLTLFIGTVAGIIGFFVVPVVGLFLFFVLGVFVAELIRLRDVGGAWPSTWKAIKAVGLSMLIEIFVGLLILASWGAAVLFA
jgi:uncharacterized protein YqgC (DUF456 family)